MQNLVWHDSYSIGNEQIDKHHRLLFGLYNILCNNVAQGGDCKITKYIINALVKYLNQHCEVEEKYMRDIGYNGIHGHIAEHQIFKQKVMELQCRFIDNDVKQYQELVDLLVYWLTNHVILEDKNIIADNNTEVTG